MSHQYTWSQPFYPRPAGWFDYVYTLVEALDEPSFMDFLHIDAALKMHSSIVGADVMLPGLGKEKQGRCKP